MAILATILSGLSFLMAVMLLIKHPGFTVGVFFVWLPRLTAGALSPVWAIVGVAGAILGWASGAYWAIPLGILGAGVSTWYIWRCTRDHDGFEKAFGADWSEKIAPGQAEHMIRNRWTGVSKLNGSPEYSWQRDVPFWAITEPGSGNEVGSDVGSDIATGRELLCDLWLPASGNGSGLAFIYYHGGGWSIGDKDMFTRPFFRHLISQGHTIMDVAYRLLPEVDIYGMIGDVKRAIAWMKANADRFGVDPEKIVLGGASAGGHLALLAAYTPERPELTPEELDGADLSVCGVVSYYPPTDLLATYRYTGQQKMAGLPPVPVGPDSTMTRRDRGRLDVLLGGWPQDVPDAYELSSPSSHVRPGNPPTLLLQGEQDVLVPAEPTCALHAKLVEAGVPAINVVFPWTDHAFDAALPQINPAAQSALYDVDRFLALLSNNTDV
ncbi:MAG: alpha/beta hydrolase [Chloroflexota bacterium]|nr:MAG: alpha/beta hydrolase [Chloroflexota bacterium]